MASEYRVVPFVASVGQMGGSKDASAQLETLIQQYAAEGLEYVRLEGITTVIAGDNGCFGIGATQSRMATFYMAVFRK